MGNKPGLSDEAVREILRLHQRGAKLLPIAEQFGRSTATISRIVTGQSYRHVTMPGHRSDRPCDCARCRRVRRQEANVDLAEMVTAGFGCLDCDVDVVVSVLSVAKDHGLVLCAKHAGREAK